MKVRIFAICCYAEKLLNPGDRRENIAADDVPVGKNATVIVDFCSGFINFILPQYPVQICHDISL
jgi:hypothetical protein